MTPMWMSASMWPCRNTSRAFFDRMSTWWWSMSFGLPMNGRRSMPITRYWLSRWRRRASRRPSRPAMPVMTTVRGSAEDTAPLAQSDVDHRLDLVLDQPDLVLDHLVVVVRVAVELQRLTEVEVVLDRQRQCDERRVGDD